MIRVKCKYILTELDWGVFYIKLKIYLNNRRFPIGIKKELFSTLNNEYHGTNKYNKFLNRINELLDKDDLRRNIVKLIVKDELQSRNIDVKNRELRNATVKKIKSLNDKYETYDFTYEDLNLNK